VKRCFSNDHSANIRLAEPALVRQARWVVFTTRKQRGARCPLSRARAGEESAPRRRRASHAPNTATLASAGPVETEGRVDRARRHVAPVPPNLSDAAENRRRRCPRHRKAPSLPPTIHRISRNPAARSHPHLCAPRATQCVRTPSANNPVYGRPGISAYGIRRPGPRRNPHLAWTR